jgi:hypothetical protein
MQILQGYHQNVTGRIRLHARLHDLKLLERSFCDCALGK